MRESFDELLVGIKPQREWGILVVAYLFLGGSGAGLYLVSLYIGRPLEAVLGLLTVALGTVFLLADLGRPARCWRAFVRPGTSWISRGTFFITLLLGVGALQVAPSIGGFESLPWGRGTSAGAVLKWAAAVLAILVMIYTGFVLSPSPAIPFWNSILVPILFLDYSILAGVDLCILAEQAFGRGDVDLLALERFQGWMTLACLVLIVAHVGIMSVRTEASRAAVATLVRSTAAVPFLGGVVVAGLIVPLALTGKTVAGQQAGVAVHSLVLAGVLRLAGDYLFRHLVIRTGYYDPLI